MAVAPFVIAPTLQRGRGRGRGRMGGDDVQWYLWMGRRHEQVHMNEAHFQPFARYQDHN